MIPGKNQLTAAKNYKTIFFSHLQEKEMGS